MTMLPALSDQKKATMALHAHMVDQLDRPREMFRVWYQRQIKAGLTQISGVRLRAHSCVIYDEAAGELRRVFMPDVTADAFLRLYAASLGTDDEEGVAREMLAIDLALKLGLYVDGSFGDSTRH